MLSDYSYDYRNRLTRQRAFSSSTVTDEASYTYDPLDRPVTESESHTAGATRTTVMTYLGLSSQLAQEQQKDGAGALLTTRTAPSRCS